MDVVEMNGISYNLNDIEKDCWVRLLNGSLKGKDPMHNAAVASIGKFGVHQRTVVLRRVNTQQKQVAFHTDIRSGKWGELNNGDTISWLFYDAPARIQIRLSGTITKHYNDDVANQAWNKSTVNSKKVYLGLQGPSTISAIPTSGLSETLETITITEEEAEKGKPNFGLVITNIQWMEWLWLNSKGHRRAAFHYNNDFTFNAHWLIP